jgi:type II secretion system protein G
MEVDTLARWALVLGAIFLFSGCADNTEDAKKALQAKLHNSPDVEYRALKSFPGGVVCGEYNPEGEWGIREGYRRFIVRNNEADRIASEDDWEIFCSKKPAAKLQDRFGVGPMNKKNAALLQVHRDLNGFDLALNAYLRDNFTFPVTNQGLDALVNASKTAPKPGKFREGGYIDKIPLDPWGRPYHYIYEEQLRLEPKKYTLYTLGKDGVKGGQGEDADISNEHLKYLNHIVNL